MEIKKKTIKNQFSLYLFCIIIGAFAGAVLWVFLKVIALGVGFLWEWLPEQIHIPYYTLIVCTLGGLLIGVFRKLTGDYPEELEVVLGKVKKEKHYEYKNMAVLLVAAMLPLMFGSSVGPEAGMTGIIVGLCYWAGDNLKFAKKHAKEYSEIGTAVTLGVLFHSPLFGIFAVEEQEQADGEISLTKTSKLLLYGLALGGGAGVYMLLSKLFGAGMSGFPSFAYYEPQLSDFLMIVVYVLCGCILAVFYQLTHGATSRLTGLFPAVLRETFGGLCLGLVCMWVPAMMFSGEEQMAVLMDNYLGYVPLALIGAAFLKLILTNLCIQSGLKGGHFFPVIFAGVCMGYGVALLTVGGSGHEVFAAAIVTAALLGGIMKKPLAVTVLLFICFPARLFLWIFLASVVGAKLCTALTKEKTVQP